MPQNKITEPAVMILILLADPKGFPPLSNLVLDKHVYIFIL